MRPSGPTERFTTRVADYARWRPSFPEALLEGLPNGIFTSDASVADVGSGTGIFSRQIAPRVGTLWCVEPNREMREYSAHSLHDFPNVRIVEGRAEATGLAPGSIDTVTAAQAFHWFDRPKARVEFQRILRGEAWVVLLWYTRVSDGNPFLEEYDRLLQEYSIDYREVDHRNITPEIIGGFFHPGRFERAEVMTGERLHLNAILGRIASSSYAPPEGHPSHTPLIERVSELFAREERGGTVEFRYSMAAYYGRMLPRTATGDPMP